LPRLPAAADNAAMQTEPPQAEPPKRKRRWFQFSLRSLLIVVTVLAAVCGYVGWQAKIVNHRRELLRGIRDGSARYSLATDLPLTDPPRIPWIREWLGDSAVWAIGYRPNSIPPNLNELKACFPEAIIEPFDQVSGK
jgi:hypothetical protein